MIHTSMDIRLTIALIGALAVLLGHLVSNVLTQRRTLFLKETEFKITRYQEFLFAISAGSSRNYETQLDVVKSLNVINLMGSKEVLKEINALVENYNSPTGSAAAQWPIINRIILEMRSDIGGTRSTKGFAGFEFPFIVTDIEPDTAPPAKTRRGNVD